MKISTLLLQRGAEAGLTLASIGKILCRPDDDDTEPSTLEQIVTQAEKKVSALPKSGMRKNSSFHNLLKENSLEESPKRARILSHDTNSQLASFSKTRQVSIEIDDVDGNQHKELKLEAQKA